MESVNYVRSTIKNGARNNLQISWDEEDGFVCLLTPHMDNTDIHYHIELSQDEAKQLSLFLNKKLFELRAKRGNWDRAREILDNASDMEPPPEDCLN